jgi:hypothetical protein
MSSSWQNSLAQLVNLTDLKARDLQFDSRSLDLSNRGFCSFNFAFFATCVQFGAS